MGAWREARETHVDNGALQRSAGVTRWGSGRGGGDTDGRSPMRQRPRGHSPDRTQRGGSGGEMLHPPGHSAMQHAGDAKKAERSGGNGTQTVDEGQGRSFAPLRINSGKSHCFIRYPSPQALTRGQKRRPGNVSFKYVCVIGKIVAKDQNR